MNLIVLTSVDSTNNYLQDLLTGNPLPEGTTVLSLEQTSGRGQRGNSWQSLSADGLYASILFLPPNFSVENQYLLNKAIACGTARYIATKTSNVVKIKWPNDILVNERKIAGILIENSIRGHHISSVIAGIGVNLNQLSFEGVFETAPTSLRMETREKYDPEAEISSLFAEIWSDYQDLLNGRQQKINERYLEFLYRIDVPSTFLMDAAEVTGILRDVDDEGRAMIEIEGKVNRFFHPQARQLVRPLTVG